MQKEIYFCVDYDSLEKTEDELPYRPCCRKTYTGTEDAIEREITFIATTSLAHLSFGLFRKGYDIYLCYEDKKIKIEEGMKLSESGYCLSEPQCCEDSDILDLFLQGYFDDKLGIEKD